MPNTVACGQCGTALEDDSGCAADARKPCPVCGSTSRVISLAASETLGFSAKASVTGTLRVFRSASLLLQTVIVGGANTKEGQLIEAVALPWFEIIELLKQDPSLAFQIGDRKWEEIVAGAYSKAGFDQVTLTPRSGDYGRDVIAVKQGLGTVRVIDQVKAYGPKHIVTADDVRALLGVLQGDKASKGFLTTTSDFAPKLHEDVLLKPFMPGQIELINGKMLLARLEDLAKKKS